MKARIKRNADGIARAVSFGMPNLTKSIPIKSIIGEENNGKPRTNTATSILLR